MSWREVKDFDLSASLPAVDGVDPTSDVLSQLMGLLAPVLRGDDPDRVIEDFLVEGAPRVFLGALSNDAAAPGLERLRSFGREMFDDLVRERRPEGPSDPLGNTELEYLKAVRGAVVGVLSASMVHYLDRRLGFRPPPKARQVGSAQTDVGRHLVIGNGRGAAVPWKRSHHGDYGDPLLECLVAIHDASRAAANDLLLAGRLARPRLIEVARIASAKVVAGYGSDATGRPARLKDRKFYENTVGRTDEETLIFDWMDGASTYCQYALGMLEAARAAGVPLEERRTAQKFLLRSAPVFDLLAHHGTWMLVGSRASGGQARSRRGSTQAWSPPSELFEVVGGARPSARFRGMAPLVKRSERGDVGACMGIRSVPSRSASTTAVDLLNRMAPYFAGPLIDRVVEGPCRPLVDAEYFAAPPGPVPWSPRAGRSDRVLIM